MATLADDGGSGGGGLLPWLSAPLLITAAVVLLVVLLIATLVTWRIYRRVRRSPAWARVVAAARTQTLPSGAAREVARLRRDLRTEVEAAEAMLSRAQDGRVFTADAHALVEELKVNAAGVDADLGSIERYADPQRQQSALDTLRPQVMGLIATSYLARQTVLQTEATDRERHLSALRGQVEQQAAALENYRRTSELDLGDDRA